MGPIVLRRSRLQNGGAAFGKLLAQGLGLRLEGSRKSIRLFRASATNNDDSRHLRLCRAARLTTTSRNTNHQHDMVHDDRNTDLLFMLT